MDLAELETLVAVAQEKGFSRAAERLHRTQSAVSQAVRRLEEDVGAILFDRSSKGGALTEAGQILFEYAQQMLNARREARAALQELGEVRRGKVTLGVNEHTVMHLLPAIEAYRARHPEIAIDVRHTHARDVPSLVLSREIEIGVVPYRPSQPGLAIVAIATDELALVVAPGHRLAGRTDVPVRELGAESFVAHGRRSFYRERAVRMFERHRTPLHITIELPTLEAIKRLVERGLGVSLMPRRAAEAEISRGDLVALGVRGMRLARPVHLVHRSGAALSHAAAAFVACAREVPAGPGRAAARRAPRTGVADRR